MLMAGRRLGHQVKKSRYGIGKLISSAIVKTTGGMSASGGGEIFLRIGVGRLCFRDNDMASWFISYSLLNLPNKKAHDLDGQRLDD